MKCEDCKFWKFFDESMGDCRKRSPFLVWGNASIRGGQQEADGITNDFDTHALWPQTHEDDWCGEFSPTPKPEQVEGKEE